MSLSSIAQVVDRSIEDRLYQVAVREWYTPDREVHTTEAQYETELDAIIADKGFAVEVFGSGTTDARMLQRVPRIVYSNASYLKGFVGSDPGYQYDDQGADFNAQKYPPTTSNLRFEVRLVSKSAAQDRVLHAIMSEALPNQGWIKFYDDSTVEFLVVHVYSRSIPNHDFGLMEKIYTMEAHDLYSYDPVDVKTGIAKVTEIKVVGDADNPDNEVFYQ